MHTLLASLLSLKTLRLAVMPILIPPSTVTKIYLLIVKMKKVKMVMLKFELIVSVMRRPPPSLLMRSCNLALAPPSQNLSLEIDLIARQGKMTMICWKSPKTMMIILRVLSAHQNSLLLYLASPKSVLDSSLILLSPQNLRFSATLCRISKIALVTNLA